MLTTQRTELIVSPSLPVFCLFSQTESFSDFPTLSTAPCPLHSSPNPRRKDEPSFLASTHHPAAGACGLPSTLTQALQTSGFRSSLALPALHNVVGSPVTYFEPSVGFHYFPK